MSHLLVISIGPVQDFIAAARRTADLWAGSQLLIELSKAAARYLHDQQARLIFPAGPQGDAANKILAKVEGDPKALAEGAKQAAQEKLVELWREAIKAVPGGPIDQARAQEQLKSFLEVYAAWLPLPDEAQYPEVRRELERLLAGRKALRDFAPTQQNDTGVPKSPLDPSRAAVIDPRAWGGINVPVADGYKPLRIKATEHLDAISLFKRIYGVQKSDKVVDTRTMARRSWDPSAMPDDREDDPIPEPQPYFAILVADGDRIGELIARQESPLAHQQLSAQLDGFAQKARQIVPQYHGFMVYSRGDDVLAFLPVNRAIACAQALSQAFRQMTGGTLSAGLALVHYREPLSISLDNARQAEKEAKNRGRDALAVALHTRGGAPITVVDQWDELRWLELLGYYAQGDLTRGLAYELAELARVWPKGLGDPKALQREAQRILERKEASRIALPSLKNPADLEKFAQQLVVARFLAGLPKLKEAPRA
ncbi:MAG: type III-B CRISPR-associated protein Cas10/Cmr2 [Meiothermus sp.]